MIAGIDLGGTTIKIGFYDGNKIVYSLKLNTEREKGYKYVVSKIANAILSSKYNIDIVGIGSPGSIDQNSKVIKYSPNFSDWIDVNIGKDLQDILKCEVFIDNDANIFALGERYFGAAKNDSNFVSITIGTGIGGGIFVNGELLLGENGFAGEIGHMKVTKDGPVCGCGKRGCFEAWCSSENIKKRYNETFKTNLDTRDILRQKDGESLMFLNETFEIMGMAISNLINIFNPSLVVLGGGLIKSYDLFIGQVKENIEHYVLPSFKGTYRIESSNLGDNAAILGAISLAIYKNNYRRR
jgi:glucokinase